jgi:hypothetical protein
MKCRDRTLGDMKVHTKRLDIGRDCKNTTKRDWSLTAKRDFTLG